MDSYNTILSSLKKELDKATENTIDNNSDMNDSPINNTIESLSEKYFNYFNNNIDELIKDSKKDTDMFNDGLYKVWGKPLGVLEIIIEIITEATKLYSEAFHSQAEKENNYLFRTLRTIHSRVLLISKECQTLLLNGYSNGAFSLWRSMYELSVIAKLLNDNGDDYLCHKYSDYYYVQLYNEEKQNRDNDYPSYTDEAFEDIIQNYNLVKEKYGNDYANGSYGWANDLFENGNASFKKIEEKANMDYLRGYYISSSNFIHGNQKANYDSMGTKPNSEVTLTITASQYGLSIPMQNTALSLVLISKIFFNIYPNAFSSAICLLLNNYLNILMEYADKTQRIIEDYDENVEKTND